MAVDSRIRSLTMDYGLLVVAGLFAILGVAGIGLSLAGDTATAERLLDRSGLAALLFAFLLDGAMLLYFAPSEALVPAAVAALAQTAGGYDLPVVVAILLIAVVGATAGQTGPFLLAPASPGWRRDGSSRSRHWGRSPSSCCSRRRRWAYWNWCEIDGDRGDNVAYPTGIYASPGSFLPMDEKTESLRDIFIDVSGEERVTESQEGGHGSLTDVDETTVMERLRAVVGTMRDRYAFRTALDDETLAEIVRAFYGGKSDEEIAAAVDGETEQVAEARFDLHLLRESDTDAPVDLSAFRKAVGDDAETTVLADRFDIDEESAAHYRRVVEAQTAATAVSQRFQSAFEDALGDAGLSTRLTASLQEDGLDEATEDIDSLDSDADISM